MSRDLAWAWRQIRRRPRFAAAVAVPLGFGLGALIAAFAVVSRLLFAPLALPEAERLATLDQSNPALGGVVPFSSANYLDLAERQRSFAAVAAYRASQRTRTDGPRPERLAVAEVTPSFFDVVATRPLAGSAFTAEHALLPAADTTILTATPYLILGHELWRTRFGARGEVLGTTVELDGVPHRVVGIMPPGFEFPAHAEAWAPLAFGGAAPLDRGGFYLQVLARLAPGVDLERAARDLERVAVDLRSAAPEANRDLSLPATPLRERLVGEHRTALWLLFGLAAIIVVAIAANVAQMLLARALERRREAAIRLSLGASRGAVARQLLIESLLLAGIGWLLGLAVAATALELLLALSPVDLLGFRPVAIDLPVVLATLAFAIVAAVSFGIAPALTLARPQLVAALAEGDHRASLSRRQRRFQRLLLAGQVAVAVVLLTSALLVAGSYRRVRAVDLGFEPEGLLSLDLTLPDSRYGSPDSILGFAGLLLEELESLPGAAASASALRLPVLDEAGGIWFQPPDGAAAGDSEPAATFNTVSAGYFEVLGIPLLRGRGIEAGDGTGGTPVMVIDDTLARRYFPDADPVGEQIVLTPWPEMPWTIVGVAGGVPQGGLRAPRFPALYVPLAQVPIPRLRVLVRTAGDPGDLIRPAQERLSRLDRTLAFETAAPLERRLDALLRPERFTLGLVGAFGVLGLLQVAFGVYGSTAYLVTQRRAEHGVRLALGGRPADIVRGVVLGGLPEVLAGLAAGGAAVLALARFGRTVLFEIAPTDPRVLAVSLLGLAAVTVLAMLVPARRASRLDPGRILRGQADPEHARSGASTTS